MRAVLRFIASFAGATIWFFSVMFVFMVLMVGSYFLPMRAAIVLAAPGALIAIATGVIAFRSGRRWP